MCIAVDGAVSLSRKRNSNAVGRRYRGFEWLHAGATISVDLNLEDPNTALFLELLYFT